jgi:hypothetical protein
LRLCPFADEILASYPLSQIDTLKADVTLTGMTAMEKIGKDRKKIGKIGRLQWKCQ